MKSKFTNIGSGISFLFGMAFFTYNSFPLWLSFAFGAVLSIATGFIITFLENWESVKETYLKALEDYDREVEKHEKRQKPPNNIT
jgi:hypothetical protein